MVFFDFDQDSKQIFVSDFENISRFKVEDFLRFQEFFKNTKTAFFNAKETFYSLEKNNIDF